MAVLEEKITEEVNQQVIERVDKRIQDPLDSLRLFLKRCHTQNSTSAAKADDLTRILRLINELSSLQQKREIRKIINKLEEIVRCIRQFRNDHKDQVPDEIVSEAESALEFCKEEVSKYDKFIKAIDSIRDSNKLPKNSRAAYEMVAEGFEELSEIIDKDYYLLPKSVLKILVEISFSVLEQVEEKVSVSERKDKLRIRIRNAAYFILRRIEEVEPNIALNQAIELIKEEGNPSIWDNPPKPTEALIKAVETFKKSFNPNDSWDKPFTLSI